MRVIAEILCANRVFSESKNWALKNSVVLLGYVVLEFICSLLGCVLAFSTLFDECILFGLNIFMVHFGLFNSIFIVQSLIYSDVLTHCPWVP